MHLSSPRMGRTALGAIFAIAVTAAGCKGVVDGEPRAKAESKNAAAGGEGTSEDVGGGSGESGEAPTVTLDEGTVVTPLPSRIRRLTNVEYDNSAKALLHTTQEL